MQFLPLTLILKESRVVFSDAGGTEGEVVLTATNSNIFEMPSYTTGSMWAQRT